MPDFCDEKPTVLVVDDMEENHVLFQRLLEPRGFSVRGVSSGEQALAVVEEKLPDLVILDLILPSMDGFEVCRRLKQDDRTRHIPVIVVTGLIRKEANIMALEMGADDFLVKPIEPPLLFARVRGSLQAKRLQDKVIEYQQQLEHANRGLEANVRERTTQLERIQQVTVFSLAKLSESRDNDTGRHLERIRLYARELAQELLARRPDSPEISERFVQALFQSSPLHDIGKVGIPDFILLKPAKLSSAEFSIMKHHTVIGGDTLEAANREAGGDAFLSMGRDIAYYHHERWDGTGYPRGLGGEEIPLAARIVSLSDVYDALTSKRPYKPALSHEQSREIILAGEGEQFDPELVEAFLAREVSFLNICQGLHDTGEIPGIMKFNKPVAAE